MKSLLTALFMTVSLSLAGQTTITQKRITEFDNYVMRVLDYDIDSKIGAAGGVWSNADDMTTLFETFVTK